MYETNIKFLVLGQNLVLIMVYAHSSKFPW